MLTVSTLKENGATDDAAAIATAVSASMTLWSKGFGCSMVGDASTDGFGGERREVLRRVITIRKDGTISPTVIVG